MEKQLEGISAISTERLDISSKLLEIRAWTDKVVADEKKDLRLNWWDDILMPIFILSLLIYYIRDTSRAEDEDGQSATAATSKTK